MDRIHLEHLEHRGLTGHRHLLSRLPARQRQLGLGHEPLQVPAQIHHDPVVLVARDLALELHPDRVRLGDLEPGILLQLLEAQRDALVLRIDVEDRDLDRVALLHDLRRVLHTLGPRHVGDVNQAVDARLDLHERAERGEVANLARDARAHGVLHRQHHPRILLGLLHPEGDLLLLGIDLEDDRFDGLADGDDLGGMPHVAGPAHLTDVYETLDARLQLHERTVVGDADDLPLDARADRVLLGHVLPGILIELLEAQRDALPVPVDVEHLDLDLLPQLDHVRGMRHPAPAHVRDVQQAIHAAQVDERTKVGDVLDDALSGLADLELLHEELALVGPLGLQNHAARHNNVAAPLVELDDLEVVGLSQKLVDVGHPPESDLAPREERIDAHQIHHHSALDLLLQRALDGLVVLVRLSDLLPHAHEVGLLLRENDRAVLVLEPLEQDVDLVARLHGLGILELVDGNSTLGLEAHVQDHVALGHPKHLGLDDLPFLDALQRTLVQLEHLLVLVVGVPFVVEIGSDWEGCIGFCRRSRHSGGGISGFG